MEANIPHREHSLPSSSGGKKLTSPLHRHTRWLRVLLPSLIILGWTAMAGFGGPLFGRVGEVSSNDPSIYLPNSAESTEAGILARGFFDSDDIPALVLVVAQNGKLTEQELADTSTLIQSLASIDGIAAISPSIPSDDGAATQTFVAIDPSGEIGETVTDMREILGAEIGDELNVYVTGPAGLTADLSQAFSGIDGLLLAVALVAVMIILLVVYRSLLLPLAVLLTSVFALCAALLVVWLMARADIVLLSGQTQGILFILVIGAATDYSLLYVSRYREELPQQRSRQAATFEAWKRTVEPVLASGGTVIAGLLCLLLSDLKSNSALGPIASIGIIFAMLAALTLLPAILLLLGRTAFWPRIPRFDPHLHGQEQISYQGVWGRTVKFVERRARPIWILTTLFLVVGAAAAVGFKAEGVPQTDLVLSASEARDGQEALALHFPGGSGSPTLIITPEKNLAAVAEQTLSTSGVDSLSVATADLPSGQAPVTTEGISPLGPPGSPEPVPTTVDGMVMLQATLVDAADSNQAMQTIKELRTTLHHEAPGTLIGGPTATAADTQATSARDRNLIIPIILIVILGILMVLLRAIVAPLILILTTILSFGTAMGVAAIVFNQILKLPGADPAVPLYSFVFLVALGIDYNIFLMTRVREESKKYGTHQGIVRGLAVTGTVITSAGLVLAATFAALAVIPILFLFQLAFIVAFGVLLDTFVVRTLLVPALSLEIGRRIWWPSRLSRQLSNSEQKQD